MATEMDRAYCEWAQHDEISSQKSCQETSISQLLDHGSISFGRFAVETLSWEKWSVFTHNRCKEELEQFKAPGLVAQKKAYFEEYYRKIRALKGLQSQEEKPMVDSSNDTSVSSQNAEDTHGDIGQLQNSRNGEKNLSVQSMENTSEANQVFDDTPVIQRLGGPCPDYSTRSSGDHRTEEGCAQVSRALTLSERCSNETVAETSQQKHDNMDVEMKGVTPIGKVSVTTSAELCNAEVVQKDCSRSVNCKPDSKKKEHHSSLRKKENPTPSVRSSPRLLPKSTEDTVKSSQRVKYALHNEPGKNEIGSSLSKTGSGRISSSRKSSSVSSDKPIQDKAAMSVRNSGRPNVNVKSDGIRSSKNTIYPSSGMTRNMKQINVPTNKMSAISVSVSSHGKRSTATQSINSSTKTKSLTTTTTNSVSTPISSRSTKNVQASAATIHLFPVSTEKHVGSRENGVRDRTKTNGSSIKSLSFMQNASTRIVVSGGIADITSAARRINNEAVKKPLVPDSSRALYKLRNAEDSGLKAMPTSTTARSVSNQKNRSKSHASSNDGSVHKEGIGEAQLRKNQGITGFSVSRQPHPSYAGPRYISKKILSQSADLSRNGRKPWG